MVRAGRLVHGEFLCEALSAACLDVVPSPRRGEEATRGLDSSWSGAAYTLLVILPMVRERGTFKSTENEALVAVQVHLHQAMSLGSWGLA